MSSIQIISRPRPMADLRLIIPAQPVLDERNKSGCFQSPYSVFGSRVSLMNCAKQKARQKTNDGYHGEHSQKCQPASRFAMTAHSNSTTGMTKAHAMPPNDPAQRRRPRPVRRSPVGGTKDRGALIETAPASRRALQRMVMCSSLQKALVPALQM